MDAKTDMVLTRYERFLDQLKEQLDKPDGVDLACCLIIMEREALRHLRKDLE